MGIFTKSSMDILNIWNKYKDNVVNTYGNIADFSKTEEYTKFINEVKNSLDNKYNKEVTYVINSILKYPTGLPVKLGIELSTKMDKLNKEVTKENKPTIQIKDTKDRIKEIEKRRQEELETKYGKNLELISSKNNTVIQRNGLWNLGGKDYRPQNVPTEQIFAEYDKINAKYDAELESVKEGNKVREEKPKSIFKSPKKQTSATSTSKQSETNSKGKTTSKPMNGSALDSLLSDIETANDSLSLEAIDKARKATKSGKIQVNCKK